MHGSSEITSIWPSQRNDTVEWTMGLTTTRLFDKFRHLTTQARILPYVNLSAQTCMWIDSSETIPLFVDVVICRMDSQT